MKIFIALCEADLHRCYAQLVGCTATCFHITLAVTPIVSHESLPRCLQWQLHYVVRMRKWLLLQTLGCNNIWGTLRCATCCCCCLQRCHVTECVGKFAFLTRCKAGLHLAVPCISATQQSGMAASDQEHMIRRITLSQMCYFTCSAVVNGTLS